MSTESDFQTTPGPIPTTQVDFGDCERGNFWICDDQEPEWSDRVPVQLVTEGGERLSATLSVEGVRAMAAFIHDRFPEVDHGV